MRAFGMVSKDAEGAGPVKKPMTLTINSAELYKALTTQGPECVRYVQLLSGRAAAAQVYPKKMQGTLPEHRQAGSARRPRDHERAV